MDDSQLLPSRYYALAAVVMIGAIAGTASLIESQTGDRTTLVPKRVRRFHGQSARATIIS
jgi:hypothetical protein